jgi:hypothetical protein
MMLHQWSSRLEGHLTFRLKHQKNKGKRYNSRHVTLEARLGYRL